MSDRNGKAWRDCHTIAEQLTALTCFQFEPSGQSQASGAAMKSDVRTWGRGVGLNFSCYVIRWHGGDAHLEMRGHGSQRFEVGGRGWLEQTIELAAPRINDAAHRWARAAALMLESDAAPHAHVLLGVSPFSYFRHQLPPGWTTHDLVQQPRRDDNHRLPDLTIAQARSSVVRTVTARLLPKSGSTAARRLPTSSLCGIPRAWHVPQHPPQALGAGAGLAQALLGRGRPHEPRLDAGGRSVSILAQVAGPPRRGEIGETAPPRPILGDGDGGVTSRSLVRRVAVHHLSISLEGERVGVCVVDVQPRFLEHSPLSVQAIVARGRVACLGSRVPTPPLPTERTPEAHEGREGGRLIAAANLLILRLAHVLRGHPPALHGLVERHEAGVRLHGDHPVRHVREAVGHAARSTAQVDGERKPLDAEVREDGLHDAAAEPGFSTEVLHSANVSPPRPGCRADMWRDFYENGRHALLDQLTRGPADEEVCE